MNDVASRSEQFLALLPKYQANPQLFTQQRLLDTLTRVMTNAQDKIFVSERADGKPKELRLLLNPDPRIRPAEENR